MQIDIENVTLNYGKSVKALSDVNLSLSSPGLVGLVGPNGAGKSTLMKLLVGQLRPTQGDIRVDGTPLRSAERRLKQALGYLPQEFGLYNEMRSIAFLEYIAALKGIPPGDRTTAACAALESVGMADRQGARIRSLSGGQKQRIGLAQALLGDPAFLIVDEPTVGLDPEERIRFRNLLSARADHTLVLLSTHIIDDVESTCNRIVILHSGRILFDGPAPDLVRRAEGRVFQIESTLSPEWTLPPWTITSRIVTPTGARYRLVGTPVPGAVAARPTLEEAYVLCLHGGLADA